MFQLTIKNIDGSIYWQTYFNSRADVDRWLTEERKRAYWNSSYVIEIVDQTPIQNADDLAAIAARNAQTLSLKQRVRALADQADLTNADIKEAIFKYIKMKVLQGEL